MVNRRTVIAAIRKRHLLEIQYDGRRRVVEPHTLFEDQAGAVVLNCWQVEGFSASKKEPPWRNLSLPTMESVRMLETSFSGPRPGYHARSPQFAKVIAGL